MSFVVLDALAELKDRLSPRPVTLIAPQSALPDNQTTEWIAGLDIGDSVAFYHGASEAGIADAVSQADVLLSTATNADDLLHTAIRARQVGLGTASVFNYPEAVETLDDYTNLTIRDGSTRTELADAILAALEDRSDEGAASDIHAELASDLSLIHI